MRFSLLFLIAGILIVNAGDFNESYDENYNIAFREIGSYSEKQKYYQRNQF